MKKIVCAVLILMMVCGVVFAGGQQGAAGGAGKRLTYYYWNPDQRPGMDATVNAYTQATGIQVETTIIPFDQMWTKLQTSLPSNQGPDVFWCNQTHAVEYLPAGLVQEISSYIARDNVDMNRFPETLVDMYSYNGKVYGIPKDYDTIGLWYNKAHFDEAGIPYPTDNWTWADLRAAAAKLTKADGSRHGFAVAPALQTFMYPWVLSNGGTLMNADRTLHTWNSPANIEAVKEALRFIDEGSAPTGAAILEMDTNMRFQGGLVSMVIQGSWRAPPFIAALGEDNVGCARIPVNTGKQPGNVIHGLGFCISNRSQFKEEAWGLVKAYASQAAGDAQAKVVIPAFIGADTTWVNNFPKMNAQVFVDAASYAYRLPCATSAAAVQDDIVNNHMQSIFLGRETVEAGLAAIDADCAAAFAAARK